MEVANRTIIFLIITFLLMVFTINTYAVDWGLKKIEVEKSWNVSKGQKIIVAIIDTGMDISHPDLKNNLWVNNKEIPGNGIDDDKNGFIDDVNGWNFVKNDNKPIDNHGHGTHIAGIVKNVAPQVQLMVLKYFDPKSLSDKNLSNTVAAIDYAIKNGAQIINYSGGGYGKNPAEETAIERARAKNILFVAAAGNENNNSDTDPFYPASYELSNIVSVASLTEDSDLVESSNYGKASVDIAAPGKGIFSTLPNNRYGHMTGTSQATAFVTGTLALMMASDLEIKTSENFITHLMKTGEIEENLAGKTKYKVKLNSYRALAMKGDKDKITNVDLFSSDPEKISANLDQLIRQSPHRNPSALRP